MYIPRNLTHPLPRYLQTMAYQERDTTLQEKCRFQRKDLSRKEPTTWTTGTTRQGYRSGPHRSDLHRRRRKLCDTCYRGEWRSTNLTILWPNKTPYWRHRLTRVNGSRGKRLVQHDKIAASYQQNSTNTYSLHQRPRLRILQSNYGYSKDNRKTIQHEVLKPPWT